jgi:hypothetical protein
VHWSRIVIALTAASLAVSCVSARMSDHASDRFFRERDYDAAVESLRKGLEEQGDNGRDQLLYLLDLGLTLHTAGRYLESNQVFARADKVAEIKDYTSISTEAGTFLTSENIKDYKGEDFEKVMINAYMAMNYAALGDVENALVEARLVNRKLQLMITEGQRKYKQNAFARYLAGMLYEAERNWDDAYIDYKMTFDLEPDTAGLGLDLWRMAWLRRSADEMERWEKQFSLTAEDKDKAKAAGPRSSKGEIIVIFENGISPIKRPNPSWNSLPHFYPRENPVRRGLVSIGTELRGSTYPVHSIEKTAIENLEENYASMVAKKIGGVVAKEIVANQIEKSTDSPLLGLLAKVIFYATDQADLRSWNLLPKDLQILRVTVEPGVQTVKLEAEGSGEVFEKTVQVRTGGKVFVPFRYIPR